MKYIGPFLKLNSLNKENIKNQLFYISKESVKLIVLNSELGIKNHTKKSKNKSAPNNDISIFNSNSPLLCVYKKGAALMETDGSKLTWPADKIKKEVPIASNGYMTLALLELSRHFNPLEQMHNGKFTYSSFYASLSKNQLEFYAANLRNFEGAFVNKKHITDSSDSLLQFEEKSADYKFSDQALIMTAFYSCSEILSSDDSEIFKNFSFDIFNMFKTGKENLYNLSLNELAKICLSFNIFYHYTKSPDVLAFLLDISDCTICKKAEAETIGKYCTLWCMLCLNYALIYQNTNLLNYKEEVNNYYEKLKSLYSAEYHMLIKETDKKEITYTCEEIMLYLTCLILCDDIFNDIDDTQIVNIFKHQVIESGIIKSWPDMPNLDNPERYKNFTLISEDLLDEQNFRFPSMPTPEACQIAPVFLKSVSYNKKKISFSKTKNTFYTNENMFLSFLFIYLFKPQYDK